MDLAELASFAADSPPRVGVVGGPTEGNVELVHGLRRFGVDVALVDPFAARDVLVQGDVALVRLDVLPTLDGVEPGLETLAHLQLAGIRLINRPEALLRAHDKLLTACVLARAGFPHPATEHLIDLAAPLGLEPPVVLKPRFGSWGKDVVRCQTRDAVSRRLLELADRGWFRAQGVLVQELVPAEARDLRIVVAGGRVVGAIERIAVRGEWRTNVSVGAARRPVSPGLNERRLAVAAAEALGLDLVGVDLLRGPRGYVVIELNGAVDFDAGYSLPGRDVYADIADALGLEGTLSRTRCRARA